MKNKNKINEQPSGTGSSTGSVGDTSSTTSGSAKLKKMSKTQEPMAIVNRAAVKKTPEIGSMLRKPGVDIEVVEESIEYLSEVKDAESGDISQPFTINDKKYQMVRAINKNKEKIMGVYCFDEKDKNNKNIIYNIEEFEQKIVNNKTKDIKNEKMENENKVVQSFEGFKHFIVNPKMGKARKFKSIEELAKAQMTEDEKYMGIKEFKNYVDEVLFGTKKTIKENPTAPAAAPSAPAQGGQDEMKAHAQRLLDMITSKVPKNFFVNASKNVVSQKEAILAFAKMLGVEGQNVSKIIAGVKDIAKTQSTQQGQEQGQQQAVTEGKKVLKTIKVKDIK
jgi:hypothetical protein